MCMRMHMCMYMSCNLFRTRTRRVTAFLIWQVKSEKDSIGGTVACVLHNVPPALGEPVLDRLEAKLVHNHHA